MSADMMTCDRVDLLLADWLEGTLDDATRLTVDTHLAACTRCADVVARLDEIPPRAAALPLLQPSRDLWAGIAPRLEAPVIALADRRPDARTPAVQRRSWPARYAATAALMVATAGTTWYVAMSMMPTGRTPTVIVDRSPAIRGGHSVRPVTSDAAFADVDGPWEREVTELQRIVRERRGDVDPSTLRTLEQNLAVINEAIAQSRAALRKDPSSFLAERLNSARDKKLHLLRTVALLPSTT